MTEKPKIPQQDIILDTCIVQYAGSDPSKSVPFQAYLSELVKRNFKLTISNFSIYELLQGTTKKQEKEGAKVLNSFKRIEVSDRILVAASRLGTLYNREKIPKDQISSGDKIIAATAILRGALIITSNGRDFPRPFFSEVEHRDIQFKSKRGSTALITVFILSPNQTFITDCFNKRA